MRMAFSRFSPASVERPLSGRCDPTSTTGNGTFSVRLRKYAVSSSEAVPWPITMPASSGCSLYQPPEWVTRDSTQPADFVIL